MQYHRERHYRYEQYLWNQIETCHKNIDRVYETLSVGGTKRRVKQWARQQGYLPFIPCERAKSEVIKTLSSAHQCHSFLLQAFWDRLSRSTEALQYLMHYANAFTSQALIRPVLGSHVNLQDCGTKVLAWPNSSVLRRWLRQASVGGSKKVSEEDMW